MTGRLLSITQLRERIPLAPSRIYELLALKHIPAPLKIGRRNFWVEAEIEEWIAGLTEKRDAADGQRVPLIPALRRGEPVEEAPGRKEPARPRTNPASTSAGSG